MPLLDSESVEPEKSPIYKIVSTEKFGVPKFQLVCSDSQTENDNTKEDDSSPKPNDSSPIEAMKPIQFRIIPEAFMLSKETDSPIIEPLNESQIMQTDEESINYDESIDINDLLKIKVSQPENVKNQNVSKPPRLVARITKRPVDVKPAINNSTNKLYTEKTGPPPLKIIKMVRFIF